MIEWFDDWVFGCGEINELPLLKGKFIGEMGTWLTLPDRTDKQGPQMIDSQL